MIDDPDKTDRLVDALETSLPIETKLSSSLIQTLSKAVSRRGHSGEMQRGECLLHGKRNFPRILTPAISTDRLGVGNGIWSGGGSLCEVEGQQIVDISIARALRQFGKDVAQPR